MSADRVPDLGTSQEPVISVITVCRNSVGSIKKTIQSVLWQDYAGLEYVVVDGMSTDGTWEIVQEYRDRIAVLRHEPDTGIYNAMNKAIGLSTGEALIFLNADDYFVSPYVLSRAAAALDEHRGVDVIYGDYLWDSGTEMRYIAQPARVTRKYFLTVNPSIMHQAMFCRRRAFDQVGRFDEVSLRIAADKDWNIRAFLVASLPYLHLPLIVSTSRHGGYSTVAADELAREKKLIEARYFSRSERAYHGLWRIAHRLRTRLKAHDFSLPRFLRLRRGEP
jgi:glycosyltransferase involved in cell wall biosynthesis